MTSDFFSCNPKRDFDSKNYSDLNTLSEKMQCPKANDEHTRSHLIVILIPLGRSVGPR